MRIECQTGEREQICSAAAGETGGFGIGGQLLLQLKACYNPVDERMIKVKRQSEPARDSGDIVGSRDMRHFMRQDRPAFRIVPAPPIARQQSSSLAQTP